MSLLANTFFLNRLRSLQWLCSDTDEGYPKALLFIPGQDGRNNDGSMHVLKYLFKGSVGKDLYDETLETALESLEDMVFLIKETSVSILYSETMKKLILPLVSVIPRLVEYTYSAEEEADIDQFQLRKCDNFKKMILEGINPGEGIGIPVPVAYDDILEVEGWPLLQAFAMDQVYTSTGFFTARYNVVDMTTHLETLFRSVDNFYVDNAINLLSATIVPHCHQLLSALDAPTVSQRDRITADDAIGPLDVLYEFGELDALAPLEKMNRPVLLFGAYSSFIGNITGPKASKWKEQVAEGSLHAVVEGCEPSTGLRWSRTYFLKHGTEDRIVQEVKKLHDELSGITTTAEEKKGGDSDDEVDNHQIVASSADYYPSIKPHDLAEMQSSLAVLNRMQQLYIKLWLHLRRIVQDVFLLHHDVLDAGTEIQQRLVSVFSGNYTSYANQLDHPDDMHSMQESIQLLPHEKLQLHMDCMNAVGEVVTVDDVDDMGGACWTYIRASVHGIHLANPADGNVGAVAVGDTFLFAPLATRFGPMQHSSKQQLQTVTGLHAVSPFLQDHCCITSNIPYYQSYIGQGAEEEYSRLVQYCSKHNATLSPLQVGRSMDFSSGASSTTLSIITDHAILPNFDADLKLYSAGFIMERMNGQVCLPLVISFAHHVESSYSIDFQDCFQQIKEQILLPYLQQANNSNHKESLVEDLMASIAAELPSGYLIVYKLKALHSNTKQTAFDRLLPTFHTAANGDRHIGLCLKYSSATASSSSASKGNIPATVTEHWRAAMRMYDVTEHKGREVKIPRALLQSFLTLLDRWMTPDIKDTDYYLSMDSILLSRSNTVAKKSTSEQEEEVQKFSYCDVVSYANDYHIRFGMPGEGITAMRCMHAISEAQRLSSFDFQSLLFSEDDSKGESKATDAASPHHAAAVSVLVAGLAGSGVEVLGAQLYQQLHGSLDHSYTTELIKLDFTHLFDNSQDLKTNKARIKSFIDGKIKYALRNVHAEKTNKKVLLFMVLVISPQFNGRFTDLVTFLGSVSQSRIVNVTAVLSPAQTFAHALTRPADCLGLEFCHAIGLELIAPSGSDAVIVIEQNSTSAAFTKLRSYIRRINPTLQSMRLTPTNLNLMEEDIQYFVTQIQHGFDVHAMTLTEREACCMSLGYPSPLLQGTLGKDALGLDCGAAIYAVPDAPASIRVFKLSPAAVGVSQWSLSSILKVVSFLFPQAKTGSNAVMHFWAAVSSPKQGFQRLLQIASAKVLSEKHHREIERQYTNWIESIAKRKQAEIDNLKAGLISIHGTLYLHNESLSFSTTKMDQNVLQASTAQSAQSCLLVEGNEGFVSIREKTDDMQTNHSPSESNFTLVGSFSKEALLVLQELFKACEKFKMARKKLLRAEEMNKYEKIRIQGLKRFKDRALPAGWWFDGHFFVDHRGDNVELRPDVDDMVAEYMETENRKISDYNTLLDDLGY